MIEVAWQSPLDLSEAKKCAEELALPLVHWTQAQGVVLLVADQQAGLARAGEKPIPATCGWGDADLKRRSRASLRGDILARACGISGGRKPDILDGTGGFGRDAWLLAAWGASVRILERNKVMAWLLRRAWQQEAQKAGDLGQRIRIHAMELTSFCDMLTATHPAVIYLDPMFPTDRRHRAKNGKRMNLLQSALGQDAELSPSGLKHLLESTLSKTCYRVVLKRPRHAPVISTATLNAHCGLYHLTGSSSRFDIYTKRSLDS